MIWLGFSATFVEKFDTFWTGVSATIWDGVSDRPGPVTAAPTEGVIGDLAQDVSLDGCGDDGTKGCWTKCDGKASCLVCVPCMVHRSQEE